MAHAARTTGTRALRESIRAIVLILRNSQVAGISTSSTSPWVPSRSVDKSWINVGPLNASTISHFISRRLGSPLRPDPPDSLTWPLSPTYSTQATTVFL
jgi:hypothetical protein